MGADVSPILYVPWFPVFIDSNAPNAAAVNGAIISTSSTAAAIFGLFILTGYLKDHAEKGSIANVHKILSHFFALMMSYYGPNVIEISTLSVGHFSSGDRGLAIPTIGLWCSVLIWVAYQVYQKASEDAESMVSLRPFYEVTRDFANKIIRSPVLADMAVAYVLAILAGIKPNPNSCKTVASSMLVVSVGYLGYLAKFRPYKSKIDQGLVSVSAVSQVVISALNLATILNKDWFNALGKAEFVTFCYLYLQMAVLVGISLRKWYKKHLNTPIDNNHNNLSTLFIQPHNDDDIDLVGIDIVTELARLPTSEGAAAQRDGKNPNPDSALIANPARTSPAVSSDDSDFARNLREFLNNHGLTSDDDLLAILEQPDTIAQRDVQNPIEWPLYIEELDVDEHRVIVELSEEDGMLDPCDNPLLRDRRRLLFFQDVQPNGVSETGQNVHVHQI